MSHTLAFDAPKEGHQETRIDSNQQNTLSASSLDLMKEAHQMRTGASAHTSDASLYPDPSLTPGDALPGVTAADVCTPGYAKSVRNVPQSEKEEVFREYGITNPQPGQYEIDHLISLELGGSNDIKNLWPEPYYPAPGAHEKDKVENYLHKQVCNGNMSLEEAQREISTDWYSVYQQMPRR